MERHPPNRRDFIKIGLTSFGLGLFGSIVGSAAYERILSKLPKEEPQGFDPFFFEGNGYTIDRTGKNEFLVQDIRSGNTLPPDRMEYLHGVLGNFQNDFGCDIENVKETNHALSLTVTNPDCFFETRDKLQNNQGN